MPSLPRMKCSTIHVHIHLDCQGCPGEKWKISLTVRLTHFCSSVDESVRWNCELPYIFHTRFTTSSSFTFWTSMYPWRCITFIFRKYIQSFTSVYLFNEANDRRRYKKTKSGSMIIRAKFQYCSPWSFPWKKSKLRQLSKHFNFIHTTMRILLSWVV